MLQSDHLIVEAASGARVLTDDELQLILEHVARAGFSPTPNVRAGRRAAGMLWRGRNVSSSDRLTAAEVHFLRHVRGAQEWAPQTTCSGYLRIVRLVVLDEASGVVTSRYQGAWQLAVVRRSNELRGPQGFDWVLVEYRVGFGHWVTAYQPRDGLHVFEALEREDVRWLRRPK